MFFFLFFILWNRKCRNKKLVGLWGSSYYAGLYGSGFLYSPPELTSFRRARRESFPVPRFGLRDQAFSCWNARRKQVYRKWTRQEQEKGLLWAHRGKKQQHDLLPDLDQLEKPCGLMMKDTANPQPTGVGQNGGRVVKIHSCTVPARGASSC